MARLLMTLVMFAVFFGRIAEARAVIADGADQAARAASIAPDPGTAARARAGMALASYGLACGFRPGTVTAAVTCTAGLGGLALLRPGSATLTGTFSSGTDRFRASPRE